MGFSVSGSTAVIFLGLVVSFGIALSAAQTTTSEITQSWNDGASDMLDQKNTEIEIADASFNSTSSNVTVNVTNTGTTTLDPDKVDLLIDGELKTERDADVVDAGQTGVWLPGEKLVLFADRTGGEPDAVIVVTGNGVSEFKEVNS